MSLHVVILAAGKGTRMHSNLPKVLQPLAKKSLIQHVLDTSKSLNPSAITIVTGYKSELIKKSIFDDSILWRLQAEQLGTGHAVQQAAPDFGSDKTLILYGDVPLVKKSDLQELVKNADSGLALMTYVKEKPGGYGRIIRNRNKIVAIVEEKDSTDEQKKITEINTGIIAVKTSKLISWLGRLTNNNSQKEFYLTDIVKFAVQDGVTVSSHAARNELSIIGVNSKKELAFIERGFQMNKAEVLLEEGVTLMDPNRIDIRGELKCGKDVTIDVGCIFEGKVSLADNVYIKAYSFIKDSDIKENTTIESYSHIESSKVGESSRIGPYARLRPGTTLENNIHIGNFVEIKNSDIGENSKVNHLSYIGDSDIGKNVNVGAGTITCNYDGVNKHRTIIEDEVFIGSNSQLVAPVKIGKGSTVGAGSTITKDIPEQQLAISRSKQINIKGWKKPSKKE
jgi:bifunctional UDP-N-acetylglucosamine pyrophosphorylase/glucosamine-1-phosphate N-acetyltransferase